MSVWTEDVVPVRRSSRRLSLQPSDLESNASSLSTPSKAAQRKLLIPKSSLIPRLKEIDERMASSEDELFSPSTEVKRGRGRPRKSPARNMTATKSPSISIIAVKEAAAATTSAATKKTPPRSRSSSRTRKTAASAAPATAASAASPAKPKLPKIVPVLSFDDSPVLTRRSTRLASKTADNVDTNGSRIQELIKSPAAPLATRESTEQWRQKFSKKHPVFTRYFIPAMICLAYTVVFLGAFIYFDIHKKAPIWIDQAAHNINNMYDDFMARQGAASSASKPTGQI